MLTFANPGELDPRSFTTFGLNVKLVTNPIGQFGTGLKYAIAGILRLGGSIMIQTQGPESGLKSFRFVAKEESFRGKEFKVVALDRGDAYIPLPFTTALGAHWAPWMIFRELYSNMKDEIGELFTDLDEIPEFITADESPLTLIQITCPEVEEVLGDLERYFIQSDPIWRGPDLEVHEGGSGCVYYRGILVNEPSPSAEFSYNILREATLTEDRTLDSWNARWYITRGLSKCDDQELAERILLSETDFEHKLDFSYIESFSPEMRSAIALHKHNANRSAARRARELYIEDFEPEAIPMTAIQMKKLRESLSTLSVFGKVPWESTHLARLPEGESFVTSRKMLFFSEDIFESDRWLPKLLHRMGQDMSTFDPIWAEKQALRALIGSTVWNETLQEFWDSEPEPVPETVYPKSVDDALDDGIPF